LQDDHCFHCAAPLTAGAEVDHFLPWSRFADDGIDNLVAAHPRCNGNKRDVARAIYLNIPAGTRLWAGVDSFIGAEPRELERALG
jgi:5-methylcytosine-specific restriction endonuclease McrA